MCSEQRARPLDEEVNAVHCGALAHYYFIATELHDFHQEGYGLSSCFKGTGRVGGAAPLGDAVGLEDPLDGAEEGEDGEQSLPGGASWRRRSSSAAVLLGKPTGPGRSRSRARGYSQ